MPAPPSNHLTWDDDGAPRSTLFDDVYFSKDGGLAETETVFLQGCGLPQAWAGRARFTVGELGFGTGLNMAALLRLWRTTRGDGAHLSLFSVEAHPMTAQEATRALSRWPEIAEEAAALTSAWPGRAAGFHRVDLPTFNATLDVAVMDALNALEAWDGKADAWFLDGFSPSRNPGMWRETVIAAVADRSAPGARVATYTVAGAVRRGLSTAGFAVERQSGFGAKRERLEARLPGNTSSRPAPRVAIIGGGIAGAALARAFREAGVQPRIFEAAQPGAGASGNPVALVTPRFDAGLGPPAALFAQAFSRAVRLYDSLPHIVVARRGALQLEATARDARRFDTIAESDLFEPGRVRRVSGPEVTALLGESAGGGLVLEDGLVIEPGPLLAAWLGDTTQERVGGLEREDGAWRLLGEAGQELARAEVVCLAAGVASRRLAPSLALTPVRGQAEWALGESTPVAAAFGAYAIPMRDGVLFGATHDRGEESDAVRTEDTDRNFAALGQTLPNLADRLRSVRGGARASVRATTPDFLPLAGATGDQAGLYVLSGLGSRGFCLAPLLAEHIAALALGTASPLPLNLQALVAPRRFDARAVRTRKRSRLGAGASLV